MRSSTALFLVLMPIFSLSVISPSRSQMLDIGTYLNDPWVDSVFNTMSITEKVNQLLVVDYEDGEKNEHEKITGYGGATISTHLPGTFIEKLNAIREHQALDPLVFHAISDPFGLKMDSIDHFGSVELLDIVHEPHLFYETGVAIANQCRILGIHVLLETGIDLRSEFGEKHWKLSELNQGLVNQEIIPINALNILEYGKGTTALLSEVNSWDLVHIKSTEIDSLHHAIQELIAYDQLKINDLEVKCKTVLVYKKWAGVEKVMSPRNVKISGLLNNPFNLLLKEELAKFYIGVTAQGSIQVPIKKLEDKKIAHLSLGNEYKTVFNEYTNKYTQVDFFETGYMRSDEEYAGLWSKLNSYDLIICTYYNLNQIVEPDEEQRGFLIFQDWIKQSGKSLNVLFLTDEKIGMGDVLVMENTMQTNKLAAEVIFGGENAYGKADVIDWNSEEGIGMEVENLNRFAYTLPEAVGLNSEKLSKIDSIARYAIQNKAIPGCQILVAKDNKVVYQKAFGYHTYDSLQKVKNTDLYDLASVTKVSGALPALMKLYEEGKFDLEATMGTYLPYFRKGKKKVLTYREILAHQSGLTPYIVYWKTAIRKNGKYKRKTLNNAQTEDYQYELSPGLFLHNEYKKKIYRQIRKSKLGEKKYAYSGLTFLLYPEIIKTLSGQEYIEYLDQNFYKPLGATSVTYNPLQKFRPDQITPTEYDSMFRKSQIHGKVHDEASAMMQGVSSNAGLFANANDLAKLFQMYCNYGTYGNREYLNEETLMEFARCQYPENDNRRGLGFDRPLPEPHENGNTAKSVSQLSFGHSGFTGTFAWADPEYNLVYIFLSNRVYQTRENGKLYELNIRTDIQETIYEAMELESNE